MIAIKTHILSIILPVHMGTFETFSTHDATVLNCVFLLCWRQLSLWHLTAHIVRILLLLLLLLLHLIKLPNLLRHHLLHRHRLDHLWNRNHWFGQTNTTVERNGVKDTDGGVWKMGKRKRWDGFGWSGNGVVGWKRWLRG